MRNWLLKMVAMTEYGRKRTDGSSVVDNAALEAVKRDAGIPHLPTQKTYEFRLAVSGEGPLAYQWSDKPHRLLYDACSIIEREAALRQTTQSDALKMAASALLADVRRRYPNEDLRCEYMIALDAALQDQGK